MEENVDGCERSLTAGEGAGAGAGAGAMDIVGASRTAVVPAVVPADVTELTCDTSGSVSV